MDSRTRRPSRGPAAGTRARAGRARGHPLRSRPPSPRGGRRCRRCRRARSRRTRARSRREPVRPRRSRSDRPRRSTPPSRATRAVVTAVAAATRSRVRRIPTLRGARGRSPDGATPGRGTWSRTACRSCRRRRRGRCSGSDCRARAPRRGCPVAAGQGTHLDVGDVVLEPAAVRVARELTGEHTEPVARPDRPARSDARVQPQQIGLRLPVKFRPGTPVSRTATRSPRPVVGASGSAG